jgi:uncharacterized protein (TIGR02147 family)
MNETPFHIQVIREALSKKQRANAAYSLRAFSRDLGLDPSTLSQALKGKRPLPTKSLDQVVKALRLTPKEKMHFMESALRRRALLEQIQVSEKESRFLIDESQYRVIAEWEHYAALTLCDLPGFVLTATSVAKRLGIPAFRAESVIQNLLNARLLEKTPDGSYEKIHDAVRTSEDIASQALRDSHLETLEMGKKKLESIPIELRDFSSISFAADPDQLVELKAVIREFRKKVSALAKSGKKKREVYQLALQLYPVTQITNQEK